jgi:hypothetical protein
LTRTVQGALCVIIFTFLLAPSSHGAARERTKRPPLPSTAFYVPEAMEVGLAIVARSPGASWGEKGSEASAVSIYVDGIYNQDLLFYGGAGDFSYRVMLGRLSRGRHAVSARLNARRSARGARPPEISSLEPLLLGRIHRKADEDLLAMAHSPILFARANTIDHFTDVPLIMYYEAGRERGDLTLRYTVIFSHEDGGTPSAALMARWGRATDIEWVYQVRIREGKVVERIYQGVRHETKPFLGNFASGSHPLLAVASDNNNFSDLATSAVRFALLPVRARLEASSREAIMDANPWTYRLMVEELLRERRIDPAAKTPNMIADPREYIYVEAYAEQRGTAISLVIADSQANAISESDLGDARLRVDRDGYFRIAVRLPYGHKEQLSITLRCHAIEKPVARRECGRARVIKALLLDESFALRELRVAEQAEKSLKPGETLQFSAGADQ